MSSVSTNHGKWFANILTVILIGSVWGLLEMSLGGFLHTIHFVQTGAVMGGLAISLMAVFLSITKKPLLVPLLGFIAAAFKPFSALIFGQPVTSAYVINPSVAIVMEALAFGIVTFILAKTMERHLYAKIGAGFLAGAFGIVLYAVTASIFGMGKWPMLDLSAKLQTVFDTGAPVAVAGAVMLVIGNYVGKFSMIRLSNLKHNYPRFYYGTSLALIISCWAIPPIFHLGG
ncbi:hypothetical protein DGWBC_0096 [Dehalogenimonas sp. WBC-2]|nr:hypothetical protein DGWBC_0096 [Dehalogenimonas sp. WBC-2]